MAKPKDDSKIESIYRAALKVVLREGYTGFKMKDIAEEAGVATGTVYIYFKSKEDLVNALFIHLKTAKTDAVMKAYHPADPFPVMFKKLWHAYLQVSLKEPERTMFIEQFHRSAFLTNANKKHGDKLLEPIEGLLKKGIAEMSITDAPTELLMAQLIGPIYEVVKLQEDGKIKVTPVVAEKLFQMAWNSVRR